MVALHDNRAAGTGQFIRLFYTVNEGGEWTGGAVVPSGSGPKALKRWLDPLSSPPADSLVLVTAEGIYRVDSGGTTFDRFWKFDGDPNNGRWAEVGNDGDLYFGLGNGDLGALHITETGERQYRRVGPPGDGLTSLRQGHINYILAPQGEYLYISYGGHAGSNTASVFAVEYHQQTDPDTGKIFQAWHSMYSEANGNIDIVSLGYSSLTDATPRLFFGLENASSDEMYHLERPDVSGAGTGVAIKRQLTSILRLPVDDGGDPHSDMAIYQAVADADSLTNGTASSDEFIKIEDGLDGDGDTENDRGDFISTDKDVPYGTSGRGISAKKVGTRLTLDRGTGSNTKSPALYDFELQTRQKIATLWHFEFEIDIAQSARLRQPARADTIISDIKTMIEKVPNFPVRFEKTWGEIQVEVVDGAGMLKLIQNSPTDNVGDVTGGRILLIVEEVL